MTLITPRLRLWQNLVIPMYQLQFSFEEFAILKVICTWFIGNSRLLLWSEKSRHLILMNAGMQWR